MNVRPSQHPPAGGAGRRRPAATPKGRQIDPVALGEVQALLGNKPRRRDLLIEHLHLIQDKFGHLSAPHLVALAQEMKLALAEVYEVATFYAHFDVVKDDGAVPPPVTVRVCDSLSCAMRGAEKLIEELPAKLGREVRVLRAPCMGACDRAPVVAVGHVQTFNADAAKVAEGVKHGAHAHAWHDHIGFDAYKKDGGYKLLGDCLSGKRTRDDLIKIVSDSGLRGLGGAGFPTGMKWSFIPKDHKGPVYLVINADEGEPGTFKDRYLLERDPHALIEGMIIAARAIRSETGFVYVRGEYVEPWRRFSAAVREAYEAGLLGKGFDIVVHRGAGAYICGEETGLISSLEGKKGWPKVKPPFPAIKGAFGAPTIVNNVETICQVPHIVNRGAEWFAGLGSKTQGGTRLYSVSGRVNRPGVYEESCAITLRELIERAGGVSASGRLKGVVPGGSSAPILAAHEIDVTMDVDGLRNAGTMAGSAGVIVFDETVSIPEALMVVARFYAHESCGQCTPCRESTGWIYKMCERLVEGKGRKDDLDTILDVAKRGAGTTICAFFDGAVGPYISYIEKFRAEFEALVQP